MYQPVLLSLMFKAKNLFSKKTTFFFYLIPVIEQGKWNTIQFAWFFFVVAKYRNRFMNQKDINKKVNGMEDSQFINR